MNSPGAISPPIGMSMPGEFSISNTQSRFYGNTQYSTNSMRATGFLLGPSSHMKQSFYDDYDNIIGKTIYSKYDDNKDQEFEIEIGLDEKLIGFMVRQSDWVDCKTAKVSFKIYK